MKKINKTFVMNALAIFTILLVTIGLTYAYIYMDYGTPTSRDISATSNTTDHLSFIIEKDLYIHATQDNFAYEGYNLEDDTDATAILIANNKTNVATMYYDVILQMDNNNYVRTDDDNPDLILQVTPPQGVEWNGINNMYEVTLEDGQGNEITGYDITSLRGRLYIAKNFPITVGIGENGTKEDTWNIKIIYVNLENNQAENGGKTIEARVIMGKASDQLLADRIVEDFYSGSPFIYYHGTLDNNSGSGGDGGRSIRELTDSFGNTNYDNYSANDDSFRYTYNSSLLSSGGSSGPKSRDYRDSNIIAKKTKVDSSSEYYRFTLHYPHIDELTNEITYIDDNFSNYGEIWNILIDNSIVSLINEGVYYNNQFYDINNYDYEEIQLLIINDLKYNGYLTDNFVPNYLCLSKNGDVCPTESLYRIIGYFKDGIKVIKNDPIVLNSNSLVTTSYPAYEVLTSIPNFSGYKNSIPFYTWDQNYLEYPNNAISAALNGSYLSSLGSISSLIKMTNWTYSIDTNNIVDNYPYQIAAAEKNNVRKFRVNDPNNNSDETYYSTFIEAGYDLNDYGYIAIENDGGLTVLNGSTYVYYDYYDVQLDDINYNELYNDVIEELKELGYLRYDSNNDLYSTIIDNFTYQFNDVDDALDELFEEGYIYETDLLHIINGNYYPIGNNLSDEEEQEILDELEDLGYITFTQSFSAKIGLMSISDYLFAADPYTWSYDLQIDGGKSRSPYEKYGVSPVYTSSNAYTNWLYTSVPEWVITDDGVTHYCINQDGYISIADYSNQSGSGRKSIPNSNYNVVKMGSPGYIDLDLLGIVRPVFYLDATATYITSGSGTSSDPFRIK